MLRRLTRPPNIIWLIRGDFNEIVSSDEKLGGTERSQVQMENFRETLDYCNFKRVEYKGYKCTWDNEREGHENTKLVLNQMYLNSMGYLTFPKAKVKHISNTIFDH